MKLETQQPAPQTEVPGSIPETVVAVDLAKRIVGSGLQTDAFLLANEDQLLKNCAKLAKDFKGVLPYFDVSCNTCPWLLDMLLRMEFKFSCQSRPEFQHVLAQGINPHDIYFANTSKVASHMKSAMANDIDLMAFDSLRELHKIQKSCPKARLLLSLQNGDWQELLVKAKDLNLQVIGVILPKIEGPFCKMMAWTRMAFAIGRSLGHEMSIVDIGLLDQPELNINEIQAAFAQHLEDLDNVQIIGHVGANFIENVFYCVAKVIGKRIGPQNQSTLIINDGIFNSFGRLLIDDEFNLNNIKTLNKIVKYAETKVDIFGSSGDEMDILIEDHILDFEINENEWLLFPNMGAFSIGFDANLVSVALPSKYGKFRIFTQNDEDDTQMIEKSNMNMDNLDELLASTEIVEVIVLDLHDGNIPLQQQCTIDLFEELPGLGFGGYDEAELWEDYLTNLH